MQTPIQKEDIVVGFDMDGVIIDHTENKLELAKRLGVALTLPETHSEIISHLIAREEYGRFQDALYDHSDFALEAPLMEGAKEALHALQAEGTPFVLISRRRKPANAIALLERRGLWGNVFAPDNAFFVQSPEEKNTVGMRERVTHYIDDERKVLRAMSAIPSRFLFDAFRQFDDEREFVRLFDWEMLLSSIRTKGKSV